MAGPRLDWDGFEAWELPRPDSETRHNETCFKCMPRWTKSAFAMHEAAHAAVALELGLRVEFTSIDDQQEIEITAEEAQLYPQIRAGMKVPAICTRLHPKSLRLAPKRVMVAMLAPSNLTTGHPDVDTYADVESAIAVRVCKIRGFDPDEVCDWAKREMDRPSTQEMLLRITKQLTLSGWVDLSSFNHAR